VNDLISLHGFPCVRQLLREICKLVEGTKYAQQTYYKVKVNHYYERDYSKLIECSKKGENTFSVLREWKKNIRMVDTEMYFVLNLET
jgi:hypothetical protein